MAFWRLPTVMDVTRFMLIHGHKRFMEYTLKHVDKHLNSVTP